MISVQTINSGFKTLTKLGLFSFPLSAKETKGLVRGTPFLSTGYRSPLVPPTGYNSNKQFSGNSYGKSAHNRAQHPQKGRRPYSGGEHHS